MKNASLSTTLLFATLLAACSSIPKTTSALDQARNNYQAAQSNPDVERYAPVELKQAGTALGEANTAASNDADKVQIDNLAYIANQKTSLAQEVTKQKLAEASVTSAGKEREQLRLDQRTQEANRAKANAAQANANAQQASLSAQQANSNAQQARLNAQQAQSETAEAKNRAQLAMNEAAQAEARTSQLEAMMAELSAKQTARGLVITLNDVLFGTDLTRLNADGMRTLQKLAAALQQSPQHRVLIEGFTDSTGTVTHNQDLSERRATSVRTALLELGVAANRIESKGFGESFPIASNDTSEHRQLNRRVEIVLSDEKGQLIAR